jgi:hypothetical protein|eukprot:COSAG02_NODE_4952_length_4788_cov_252.664747_4_plen_43_part_00
MHAIAQLIRNGATHLDLIDLLDLVVIYEAPLCLYMRNILSLK